MKYKALSSLVAGVALLVGAACSSGDDDDTALVDSGTPSQDNGSSTTGIDDSGDDSEDSEDSGSIGSGELPEDQDLDIEVNHPTGALLRLSRLSFDGNDIFVDAEMINSARDEITFHPGNYSSSRLRLVDDAGVEYNFVEPDEESIVLAPGDTVSGTLAFLGPLRGQPEELNFVTNLYTDDIEAFDPTDESDGTSWPAFVVPFELTWD